MARKGLSVWLLSSLTFVALVHLVDAVSAFVFNAPIRLLQLYPFVGEQLQAITPSTYFLICLIVTFVLWGITCGIAFENPVETFLNNMLSDAKVHSSVETKLVESKSEILDAMFETIEATRETIAQVKDVVCNVRAEAKEIQPLRESIENMKADLGSLTNEFSKVWENTVFQNICRACGKPLMPEFKMCPYCGESARTIEAPVITFKSLG